MASSNWTNAILDFEGYETNVEEEPRAKQSFLESTNAHGNTFMSASFEMLNGINL